MEYGKLSCAAVSAGLRIPSQKVRRITVNSDRGSLTLVGGATYDFRKRGGSWRVDS